jgi:very-short-patch-repair endonuclease
MSTFKTARARNLRKQFSDAENIIWFYLRNRRFHDLKFRRQYSIGQYFIDFYCPQLKLGIEVDGGQHYSLEGELHDRKRNSFLKSKGITLFRYSNHEVIKNTKNVIEDMLNRIKIINSSPYPLLFEERDCCGDYSLYKEKRKLSGDLIHVSSFDNDRRLTNNAKDKEAS